MNNKICLVTGATSGIGYFTALELAKMGGSVIVVGRDEEKCILAVRQIREKSENNLVSFLLADLSSQLQVRGLVKNFYERNQQLDVLVNNAASVFLWRKLSVDGIEKTFAVNHLSHFLLTNLLLDALKMSSGARVINVSSGSHYTAHLDFESLRIEKFYNPVNAYGRSKLANILFTYELARKLEGTRITSNALTPGMVATDIWKKVNPILTPFLYPLIRIIGKSPLEGARTSIYLATSPEVEGVTGKYFVDCQPVRSDPITYDEGLAKELWQVSAKLVGVQNI